MKNFKTLISAFGFSVLLGGWLLFACKEETLHIETKPDENFEAELLMAMEVMTENDFVLAKKHTNGYSVTINRSK